MSDRLGRSCIEPIGGHVLGGGALTMLIFCFLVFMYYTLPFLLSTWCWGEWGDE